MSKLDSLLEEIIEFQDAYNEEHFNGLMEKKQKEQVDKENASGK